MEKRRGVFVLIVFVLSLFYCVYSLADGGGPLDGGVECKNILTNIDKNIDYDGPLITGTFTAAWDKSQCTVDDPGAYRHYNIHVLLEGIKLEQGREMSIKKLYSLHTKIGNIGTSTVVKSLCKYTPSDWKEKFKYAACKQEVAHHFGFVKKDENGVDQATHYPVVTDVWVTQQDNCEDDNYSNALISGTIKIRMTKIEKEPEPS